MDYSFYCVECLINVKYFLFLLFTHWLKYLEDGLRLGKPAKSMVGHPEGELQSNYSVGSVYVERHSICREVTAENTSTGLVNPPLSLLFLWDRLTQA